MVNLTVMAHVLLPSQPSAQIKPSSPPPLVRRGGGKGGYAWPFGLMEIDWAKVTCMWDNRVRLV